MTDASLEDRLKSQARALGFTLAGVAAATPADHFDRFQAWLAEGCAGQMHYLHRHEDARRHPESVFHDVQSVVMLGHRYGAAPPEVLAGTPHGRVAAYAQGPDYHDLLRAKLNELVDWLRAQEPGLDGRGVVDSAPLLERDFARRAGLGWFGKNTMLIHRQQGSFFFLAALLVNRPLRADAPHAGSHCGSCTRCLEVCPTQALTRPGWLDARRCISYLTIELKESIPQEFRPGVGEWLFGCDLCQAVCPWNRRTQNAWDGFPHRDDLEALDLVELLQLDEAGFRERFRGTPLMRAKRKGLLRNALIVLGNTGTPGHLPLLRQLAGHPEPMLREAAEWAIGQIESRSGAGEGDSTGGPSVQFAAD